MIQINLIPDVKRDLLRTQAIRNLVIFVSMVAGISAVVIVVLMFVAFGGMWAVTEINEKNIKDKFDTLSKTSDINETIIVQSQLNEIKNIRKASPNTSRILNQIVTAISTTGANEVSFSSVSYDPESKTLSIEGQTPNGYVALEGFMKTVRETKIFYREESKGQSCTVNEAVNGENGCFMEDIIAEGENITTKGGTSMAEDEDGKQVLRFSVSFPLNKKALLFETKDFAVKSPSKKDVTDSKTIITDDIFTVKASSEGEKNGR